MFAFSSLEGKADRFAHAGCWYSAPIGLALFTGSMGYMERGSLDGVKAKFNEMYIPAMLANWQLWPLVQLVNFRYMPLK